MHFWREFPEWVKKSPNENILVNLLEMNLSQCIKRKKSGGIGKHFLDRNIDQLADLTVNNIITQYNFTGAEFVLNLFPTLESRNLD